MAEPIPTPDSLLSALGVKLGTVIAGLAGSVLALVMVRRATPREAVAAFSAGMGCAMYVAPAVVQYLSLTGALENALIFLHGVVGMILVSGLVRFVEKVAADPLGMISRIRGNKPEGPPP